MRTVCKVSVHNSAVVYTLHSVGHSDHSYGDNHVSNHDGDFGECEVFCEMDMVVFEDSELVVIGRTSSNHLYIDTRLWSHDCTSFAIHRSHVLLTSHSHTLTCVSLNQPAHVARTSDGVNETAIRAVERGSRLVICDPNSSKVIFQLPRGNIETIHPRPLLLSHLSDLILQKSYNNVFEARRVAGGVVRTS